MSILRRYNYSGGIYFITNVTFKRHKIIIDNIYLFWRSINNVKKSCNFKLIAYVFLPDHFHTIIDPADNDISNILQRIKMSFASYYRKRFALKSGRVWQHRFYDHMIRNQDDLNRHIDYIHYNPMKHGYVRMPTDWHHSSYNEYLQNGYYSDDWGVKNEIAIVGEYGE